MVRLLTRNLLFLAGLLLPLQVAVSQDAFAEKRLALVMGQSAYRAVPQLPNPANDAKKITELLGGAGFEVTAAPDVSQSEMNQAVSNFAAKITASGPDTVALVFYAGHGLQIFGENYLVPVDVDPKRETDIPLQAVRLNDVLNMLAAVPTRMRIIMLDACRNNPFPNITSSTGQGLAIVDTKAGAPGSFISYSTSPGAVAEDGSGSNSPYTAALLSVAKEPNLTIEEAFKRVRVAVNQATEGRQTPWDSSSLTTEFKFFSGEGAPQQPPVQGQAAVAGKPPSAARSVDDWRKELRGKDPSAAYQLVIADDTVPAYEAFVALFAQPPYNVRVRVLLERRFVMEAWGKAVAINTAASFQEFLASYPNNDLAATARTMRERVRNRSWQLTSIAGPICPCPPLQPQKKKVGEPAPKKRVEAPRKRRSIDDGDVQRSYSEPGIPPSIIMQGVGIGLGLGGGLGGGRSRPVPHTESHGPSGGACTGGSCGSGPFISDIRLKHDIVQVARTENGLGLYRYRYNWSDQQYVGVMAQEVEKIVPAAVTRGQDGFMRVNYELLRLKLMTWEEWLASTPAGN